MEREALSFYKPSNGFFVSFFIPFLLFHYSRIDWLFHYHIYIIKHEKGWDLKIGEKEKVGKGCTWECKTLENGDEQACRVWQRPFTVYSFEKETPGPKSRIYGREGCARALANSSSVCNVKDHPLSLSLSLCFITL